MTLSEIKSELKKGNKVFWSNENYEVIHSKHGEYLIICVNGFTTGLCYPNGKLIDNEKDFYSINKKHF